MSNANDKIRDAIVRHQIYLERLSAQQAKQIIEALDAGRDGLANWLRKELEGVSGLRKMSRAEQSALRKLINQYAARRGKAFGVVRKGVTKDTGDLLKYEVKYHIGLMDAAVPIKWAYKAPDIAAFSQRILNYGTFAGKTLGQMFDDLAGAETSRVLSSVQASLAQGLSIDDMVTKIIGTKATGYSDGILQTTRNSATAIVRTIDNAISNQARQEMVKANADIIQEEIFTATLDGRTTLQCASLDGKRYPVGEGPIPPLHINCRSTRVPVVNAEWLAQEAGERPYVRDTTTRRHREMDFRAKARRQIGEGQWKRLSEADRRAEVAAVRSKWADANIGQVPATTTFSQWFDRQGAGFQREYLGATRYEMYRDGKLTLGQFVDKRGHTLTLDQLAVKDKSLLDYLGS